MREARLWILLVLIATLLLAQDGNDKQSMLAAINAFRAANKKKPLCIHEEMSKLADGYAQAMLSKKKLDHYADGKQPEGRYSSVPGYKSENLFQGSSATKSDSASMALQNGLNDHSTKANLLDESATHVGLGLAVQADGGETVYYWVQVFVTGSPCDPEDKPKDPTMADAMNPPKVETRQSPADAPPPPATPPPAPPAAPPVPAPIPMMVMPVQMMPVPPPAPAPPPPKPEIPKKEQPYIPPTPPLRAKSTPEYKPVEPQIEVPKPKNVPRSKSMPAAPAPPPVPPPANNCPCGPPANGGPNTLIPAPMPAPMPVAAPAAPMPVAPMPMAAPVAPMPMAPVPADPGVALQPPPSPLPPQQPTAPASSPQIQPGSTIERQYADPGAQAVIDSSTNKTMPVDLTKAPQGGQIYTPPPPARGPSPVA